MRTITPVEKPANPFTLFQAVITSSGEHAFWSNYLLSICHLKDVEGTEPAIKHYPEAEYELLVMALDPESKPDDANTWKYLTPPNVVVQFHGCDEEGAKKVGEKIVEQIKDGALFMEPSGISGAREQWKGYVQHEVEQLSK